MKTADILAIVLDRIADHSPQHAVFDSDEVSAWPEWVLQALLTAELLREMSRAAEVFCDGCERHCLKPVVVRILPNSRKSRAFVACDEEPDLGRIEIAPERLKRYIATIRLIGSFVARSLRLKPSAKSTLDHPVVVGHVKGRNGHRLLSIEVAQGQLRLAAGGHGVALSELVHWDHRALVVDDRAIRRLLNRKPARGDPERHPPSPQQQHRRKKAKRDWQIRQEATRLRRHNWRWTLTQVAKQISRMELADGISAARVRRILYERNS